MLVCEGLVGLRCSVGGLRLQVGLHRGFRILLHDLLLQLLKKELLLLVLLHWVRGFVELLLFLEQLPKRLGICQLNDVVFIAAFVSGHGLVRCESPISVYPKLVLVPLWVEQFGKPVGDRRLWPPDDFRAIWFNQSSPDIQRFSRDDFFHFFALPVIELGADFNVFAAVAPLKNVFNLVEEHLLLLDQLCLH